MQGGHDVTDEQTHDQGEAQGLEEETVKKNVTVLVQKGVEGKRIIKKPAGVRMQKEGCIGRSPQGNS